MKVVVGDVVYDSLTTPIAVFLTHEDAAQLRSMSAGYYRCLPAAGATPEMGSLLARYPARLNMLSADEWAKRMMRAVRTPPKPKSPGLPQEEMFSASPVPPASEAPPEPS